MKGTTNAAVGRIFRCLLALCIGLGSYPRVTFAFSGTLSAPEYQAVSDIAGQVIRNAQASSKFSNGIRSLATTVEVAGVARSLAMGRVTVALAATAGAALAAYCYTHGDACTQYGTDLANYWAKASPVAYNKDQQQWQKPGDPVNGYLWGSSSTDAIYYTAQEYCEAYANSRDNATYDYTCDSATITVSTPPQKATIVIGRTTRSTGSHGVSQTLGIQQYPKPIPSWLPAPLADLQTFVDANPLDDPTVNDWPQELPIPVDAPKVKPSVVALGDPYAGPDPATGWRQDYAQVDPKPAPALWSDVNVTTGTGVVDNPNTTTVEGPKTVDEVDPTTNDQTKPDTTETKDPGLCDMYPNILACQKLGDVPNDQVPKKTVNVDYSPESVDLPVGCPADLQLPHGQVLSYASSCQAATSARPFVIALASLSALLLVVAVVRRG